MSSDKPEEAAPRDAATIKMPTRPDRPASTLHSYVGGWQPPTLDALQKMLPQYQFIEMLGAGGMGAVYKARQISLDRLVAIKILPPGLEDGSGANFTERFKQEARTMAKMNHPCIVDVYDFGETGDGQFYFVMEFVEGTDVQKMIRANKRISPEDALSITAHVCDALEYAHNRGVIHRDIKPANVLISAEGSVKIADFGLAKAVDSKSHELTRSNMAMGTPHFMAPEAMMADVKVDSRADLYAVGVMLHNMLTGEIPTGRFELPSKKTGCDRRFDRIVDKAMQADRDQRYQHASEIRKELDTILTTPVVAEGDESIPVVQPKELMRGQKMKVVTDSVLAAKPPVVPPDEMPPQKPKQDAPAKKEPAKAGPDAAKAAPKKSAAPPAAAPKQESPAPPPQKPPLKSAAPPASPGLGKIIGIMSGIAVVIVGAVVFFGTGPKPPAPVTASGQPKQVAIPPTQLTSVNNNDNALVKEVAALPPEQQVARVVAELRRLNPEFDGKERHAVSNGVVTELWFSSEFVTNIAPVAALNGLEKLSVSAPHDHHSKLSDLQPLANLHLILFLCRGTAVSDLSPLAGQPLEWLDITKCDRVSSLAPLAGMKLRRLEISNNLKPLDFSVLRGMPLEVFFCEQTKMSDLSLLASAPLTDLRCAATPISDFSPLRDKPLKRFGFGYNVVASNSRQMDIVRSIKTLETICNQPAAVFWKQVDAGKPPNVSSNDQAGDDADWQNAINLLPLADPQKDAIQGKWSWEGSGLKMNGGGSWLLLPYRPPAEYDFRTEFTRTVPSDAVQQTLACGEHIFSWAVFGQGGTNAGFEHVEGKRLADNRSRVTMTQKMDPKHRFVSLVQVRKDGVKGFLDGQLLVDWKTDYRDMNLPEWNRMRDPGLLGMGANGGETIFHRAEVREITGKGTFTRDAPLNEADSWKNAINLLPLIDPQKDAVSGVWTRQSGGLMSDIAFVSRVQLPYEPPEEYDFRITFTRLNFKMQQRFSGWGDTSQFLSKDGTQFQWLMGASGNTYFGFGDVGGKRYDANPTAEKRDECLKLNQQYTSVVSVRKDSVKAFLDGKLISEWRPEHGAFSRSSFSPMPDKKALGMGSCNVQTVFHSIEVREVTGKGSFTRPAASNK